MSESKVSVRKIWAQLETEEEKLEEEQERIKTIWAKITECHQNNEEKLAEIMAEESLKFIPQETQITLNVGGQLFQTTAGVLCRDRFSILAALCTEHPPLPPDNDGVFFLERDWWIFRHIMQFLRSGSLPDETAILKEMFAEASFYRLNSLRKAIKQRFTGSASGYVARVKVPLHQNLARPLHREVVNNQGYFDPLPDPYSFVSSRRWT
mmetsp:Transcript_29339/g.38583  ORF Transcript_29339/g.38583 Transcript_29339/m.38583 type:complete len:209 (+) Transcript_29339:332-958(+)